ncbi:type II toxin-antitoxin system RelE/ParE family toxin [Sphingomonas psychrolutea]|uniref:type II toxin-antitoxin system RelE/ParE family toxin n=1 Tax=Sphingomonas psychrolutea TaxID=1259676 RepID=UPI001E410351|nr:type II toxin-antitoxin system RelE/ParE family toxin [Sphingomonas psychrolutea]
MPVASFPTRRWRHGQIVFRAIRLCLGRRRKSECGSYGPTAPPPTLPDCIASWRPWRPKLLRAAPRRLLEFPRLGERIDVYAPREVRRIIVGRYEIRYEIAGTTILVLRLWHTLENRPTVAD